MRFTNVPLRLPRSAIENASPSRTSSAWRRETVTSSRKTSQSGERPISRLARRAGTVSPARPPPERTTSAGPVMPSSSSAGRRSSSASSASKLIVVSRPRRRDEQRAAPRAVVRGLRVLEAALGAVDVAHGDPVRSRRLAAAFAARTRFGERRRRLSMSGTPPSPSGLLQSRDELGAEDVDASLQQRGGGSEISFSSFSSSLDQRLQLVVGERRRDRGAVPRAAFRGRGSACSKADPRRGVNLSLRLRLSVRARPRLPARRGRPGAARLAEEVLDAAHDREREARSRRARAATTSLRSVTSTKPSDA